MRRIFTLTLSLLLAASLLTGCGGKTQEVDLDAFYSSLAETYGWSDMGAEEGGEDTVTMMDVEDELLDSYYPGLGEIPAKQLIVKAPMISAVVNEIVLMECEDQEGADEAAAILQDRVTTQAEGGAWYPASMEAWGNAQVVQQGTYVALIATDGTQDEIAEQFNALFA